MIVYILLAYLTGSEYTPTGGTFQIEFKTQVECERGAAALQKRFQHIQRPMCLGVRK